MTALDTLPAIQQATSRPVSLAGCHTPDGVQAPNGHRVSDGAQAEVSVVGSDSGLDQAVTDTHHDRVEPGPNSTVSHAPPDPQRPSADGGTNSQQAIDVAIPGSVPPAEESLPADQRPSDAHHDRVGGDQTSGGDHPHGDAHTSTVASALDLFDPVLVIHAESVDDLERVRISNENRLRSLTTVYGLTPDHPDVARMAGIVEAMGKFEHDATLNLQRAMRRHPLGPWVKAQKGIGEKQAARLLASIGDPYWNTLHQRPRTVSELWAYAGMHVINGASPRHQKGQQGNWNDTARMRIWLIASAMPKFPGGTYEQAYRAAREKYAASTHAAPCARCGPKGKPAPAGSDLSDGHKHARAIRIVAKEILRDLWIEARRLHLEQEN